MNTYGLLSIHRNTFNVQWHGRIVYPKAGRDVLITVLRIHNFTLNVLGYIKKTSLYSGCFRMFTGLSICVLTLTYGDPKATKGAIIGYWYKEALLTGVTQIARGAIEAFVPYGRVVNAGLDVICTFVNIASSFDNHVSCMACEDGFAENVVRPYDNPDNPLALLLCFV